MKVITRSDYRECWVFSVLKGHFFVHSFFGAVVRLAQLGPIDQLAQSGQIGRRFCRIRQPYHEYLGLKA